MRNIHESLTSFILFNPYSPFPPHFGTRHHVHPRHRSRSARTGARSPIDRRRPAASHHTTVRGPARTDTSSRRTFSSAAQRADRGHAVDQQGSLVRRCNPSQPKPFLPSLDYAAAYCVNRQLRAPPTSRLHIRPVHALKQAARLPSNSPLVLLPSWQLSTRIQNLHRIQRNVSLLNRQI